MIICSLTNWSPENIRNGRLSAQCSPNVRSLVFGLEDVNITEAVVSRSVKTNYLIIPSKCCIYTVAENLGGGGGGDYS